MQFFYTNLMSFQGIQKLKDLINVLYHYFLNCFVENYTHSFLQEEKNVKRISENKIIPTLKIFQKLNAI